MNYNPANLFGVMNIPGVGFVQGTGAGQPRGRGLGDESAVMMISGLGQNVGPNPGDAAPPVGSPDYQRWYNSNVFEAARAPPGIKTGITAQAPRAPATADVMQVPITLFNVTLPLWAWLAIAALLGGAGGAALMHFKMKR